MKSEAPVWIGAITIAAMFGLLVGLGASGATVVIIAILGGLLVVAVSRFMTTPADEKWLAKWVAIGFMVKLAGTGARFYMVTTLYGVGDSFRYYRVGTELADKWRNGQIPPLTGRGSFGTQVVEAVTGGIFAIITPDMLGGFVLFAIIAFMGQLMLYSAFRRFAQPHQLKPYAILLFLLPTYAFWPSSIGKDALVLLALGMAAYFVTRSLEAFQVRWLFGLGLALAALGVIRIHIAGLVVAAFVLAALLARVTAVDDPTVALRRLVVLGAGVGGALLVVGLFPDLFGVDILSTQDRDGFTADVFRRTSERGTIGSGGVVASPLDVPGAIAHVLYRPFPWEATEIQHFLAAGETALLALLTLWKLPTVLRNLRQWRSNGYVVFSTFYTLGFAVAFSVVRNVGIIARQRGQVLAFFLVFLVALGWEHKEAARPTHDFNASREPASIGSPPQPPVQTQSRPQ